MSTYQLNTALDSVQPLKAAFGHVGFLPQPVRALGKLSSKFGQLTASNESGMPEAMTGRQIAEAIGNITNMIRDPELSTDDALDMMKAMAESQPQLFEATSRQICQELETHGYDFHARNLAGTMAKKGIHLDVVNDMSLSVLAR
jgi:DNA-binding transcriptional regulator of glucitol operon